MLERSCSQVNNAELLTFLLRNYGNSSIVGSVRWKMAESAVSDQEEQKVPPLGGKSKREQSSIEFPYESLDGAILVAKAVQKLGGNQCRMDSLAAELGHDTVSSGGFRQKLSAAHMFGFTSLSQGVVTLKPLGVKILDPEQEKPARVEAFLKVPLYNAIYEQFKNGTLPPVQGLEAAILTLGVTPKQKEKARQTFQKSAKEAGFFAYGATKLVYPALGGAAVQPKVKEKEEPAPEPNGKNGNGGGSDGGDGKKRHPFIEGLLETLPVAALNAEKTEWNLQGRQEWLQTAAGIFNLIYKASAEDKGGAVSVSITRPSNSSAN
jgi:hypothetical protein